MEFPYLHPPVPLKPTKERRVPSIWIETLAIYRALPICEKTLLRRVKLRRGMNILWAEPNRSTGTDQPRVRISGHATGKTTFCRFLRYILGEERYGNDEFRQAFRTKFENQGWALGEVWVGGRRWLVGRPLGSGAHNFAVQGSSITSLENVASLPQGGFQDYLEAVDSEVFGTLKDRRLPSSGLPLGWDMLLQWIARDQESRFASLLNWRNSASNSSSVELQESEKENILRIVLGLSTGDEQELMRRLASVSKDHKGAVEKRKLIDYQIETEFRRVSQALGRELSTNAPLPEAELQQAVKEMRQKAAALKALVDEDPEIQTLQKSLEAATKDALLAESQWEDAKEVAEGYQEQMDIVSGKKTEADRKHKFRDLPPFRGRCSAHLTDEVLHECRFARARASDEQLDKEVHAIRSAADLLKYDKQRADAEVMERFEQLDKKRLLLKEIRTRLEKAQERFIPAIKQATEQEIQATLTETAARNLAESLEGRRENESTINNLSKTKDDLTLALDKSKAQHGARMGSLSDLFRFVVHQLLGPGVDASVDFSGKSIRPNVDFHGKLDSAALETVRLLSFDLAALADGYIHESSLLPRLLIHDSPREADLSVDIYHQIFEFMLRLEMEAGETDLPFQYIITTTEPPPASLRTTPWLINPVLNATEAKTRFLGVDL